MRHPVTLALLLALGALASAQALDEPEDREFVLPHEWQEFGKGAWVEFRVDRRERAGTDSWTERRTLIEDGDGTGAVIATARPGHEESRVSISDRKIRTPRESVGAAFVDVAGCSLFASVVEGDGLREWLSASAFLYRGLVRSELRSKDGSLVTREIVALGRRIEIAGRPVAVAVWRETTKDPQGQVLMEIEELRSPDVPGGLVRRKGKGFELRDGEKRELEIDETATDFGEGGKELPEEERRACAEITVRLRTPETGWQGFAEGSSTTTRSHHFHPSGPFERLVTARVGRTSGGDACVVLQAMEEWHREKETPRHGMEWREPVNRWTSGHLKILRTGPAVIRSCGKDWTCVEYRVTETGRGIDPSGGVQVTELHLWQCGSFPVHGGIVKEESGPVHASGKAVMTSTTTVEDLNKAVEVGGKSLRGYVLKTVNDDDQAGSIQETESVRCPDVPGEELRTEIRRVIHDHRETEWLIEVETFEARRK